MNNKICYYCGKKIRFFEPISTIKYGKKVHTKCLNEYEEKRGKPKKKGFLEYLNRTAR